MQKLSEALIQLAECVKEAEQGAEDYRKAELAGELEDEEEADQMRTEEVFAPCRGVIRRLVHVQFLADVWGLPLLTKLPTAVQSDDQECIDRAGEVADRFINNCRLLIQQAPTAAE